MRFGNADRRFDYQSQAPRAGDNSCASLPLDLASEFVLQVYLHAARRLRGNWLSEQRRRLSTDVRHVVRVIEDVEGVQRDGNYPLLFLCFAKREIVGKIQIEIDESGASH
jgi:hypothetical protein